MKAVVPFTDRPDDLTVGVLGGMGPHATVDFFGQLVRLTPAEKDWNHLHIIVEDNPRLPSRTRAILFDEESPSAHLAEGARRLERMGAGVIAVPCNSAAHYLGEARAAVKVPVLDPVVATAPFVRERRPFVLGGMVTYRARLYTAALAPRGIEPMHPTDAEQDEVAAIINALKLLQTGPDVVARTQRLIDAGAARGADAAILGCTELGLIAGKLGGVPTYDSNELLARHTVRLARHEAG